MREPPIFLTGMPGSGKTTLGRVMAKMLERDFIDLDQYIQGRFCCSVSDLFARRGEDGFRKIEYNMLHEVGEMEDVLVACGGGTPCFFDNMDYMLGCGTVFHLQADKARLQQRLCRRRAHRPAVAGKSDEQIAEYIDALLQVREPIYMRAHFTIESSELEDRDAINRTALHCISLLSSR